MLAHLSLWDELKLFARDQLLPVARQALGADHDVTLSICHHLSNAIQAHPKCTRDNLRLNQDRSVPDPFSNSDTGDDLLLLPISR